MAAVISTNTKIKRLAGLLGTADLNPRETSFVRTLKHGLDFAEPMGGTPELSSAQIGWMEDLFDKHFAG